MMIDYFILLISYISRFFIRWIKPITFLHRIALR